MPVKNARVSQAIARAVTVSRHIKALTVELDELKDIIRTAGEKFSEEGKLVEFDSPEGVATVCFYRDAVSTVEGANLWELKDTLPKVTWGDLFVERVALGQDFNDKFEQLKKRHQRIIGEYVAWSPRAPHVILPK